METFDRECPVLSFMLDRQDLRQVEADNDRLRSSLREEREKLDRAEQEHRQALADLHEQRRGLESDLTERELQMQKQLKALQKEMQVCCQPTSAVSTASIRLFRMETLPKLGLTRQTRCQPRCKINPKSPRWMWAGDHFNDRSRGRICAIQGRRISW
jgi:hypothetical protein